MGVLKSAAIAWATSPGRARVSATLGCLAVAALATGEAAAARTMTAADVEHANSTGAFTSVVMEDAGEGADLTAGDGVFTAAVPAYVDDLPRYLFTYTLTAPASNEESSVGTTPTTLHINELMASNSDTVLDPQGDDEDWIELLNSGDETIDLTGMYLSDKTSKPLKWQFPAGTSIAAGGYLLVWADDDSGDIPGLHTNFKLSSGGESVVLSDVDARDNAVIDSVEFPALDADVSYGRSPEATGAFGKLPVASPGRASPDVPDVSISAGDPVTEGGSAAFTITAAPPPSGDLLVTVTVTQGEGQDYLPAAPPTSVTVAAGSGEATLTVDLPDDTVDEPNGVLTATLQSGDGYVVSSPSSARVTVLDDDASPAASAVVINEIMASNGETVADPQGDYDDWVELYNTTAQDIDLSGMYLSDDREEPGQWQFPVGTSIGAAGYLLVWADKDTEDSPGLHADFKLSAGGESVVLSDTDDNGNVVIDAVDFPALARDESYARVPAGTGPFVATRGGTPGRRPVSNDAALSSLTLTDVDLGVFSSEQATYSARVAHARATATVAAVTNDPEASVSIAPPDADGVQPGHQVALAVGENRVTVTVTAEDGETERTYTVTVTRAQAPVVALVADAATLSEGSLAVFTATLSDVPDVDLSVGVTVTEAGSVLAGDAPSSLTFAAGSTTAELTVATVDDTAEEGDGAVTATLVAGAGYTLGDPASATVTVADDDVTQYRLALEPEELAEGASATVTVSTAGLVTRAAERELSLRVSGLSATDYRLEPSRVVLGSETTARATAKLTALDDGAREGRESGLLTLDEAGQAWAQVEFTIRDGEKLYVSGVPQVGGTLTAPELAGTGPTEHQWLRKGEAIPGATGSSHVLTGSDEGTELSVRVTRAGVTRLSEATVPIWGVPGNPPLRANEEEVLGTLLTVGFTRAYPIRLGGYGRVSRASFGSLSETTLSYGGESVELTVALVNELGEFSVGPPLGTLSEEVLWAYWDGHRIGPLVRSGSSELEVLSAPTPQERVLYRRYGRAESEGVRVALSLRREVGPPAVTLSVPTESVAEGADAVFELSLDRAPGTALEVSVEVTADGEVLADAIPVSVTMEAGSTAATLALPTVDDTVVEGDGSLTVTLLPGEGYALGETVSATVAVEDDDVAQYALTVMPAELVEGASAAVDAAISNGVTHAVPVSLELSVAGEVTAADYALESALLELAAGERAVSTTLMALADDEDEALETAQLALLLDGAEVATTALSIREASSDAALSRLDLSDVDLGGFDPETTSYTATVMAEVSTTLVTAEPADANAAVEIADASGSTLGTERTSTLATGDNEIAATVTAEDGVTERTYAVTVTREAGSGWGARVPERDVSLSDVVDPTGVWSDGATLWVSDWDRILAYALVDGRRLPSRDVSGLSELQSGLWSDGATLWQSDQAGAVRAFRLSDGARTPDADLPAELLVETGNGAPAGMWSDAAGLRVVDLSDGVVYGYGADGARASALDLDLRQGSSSFPWGLWSDGATVLVTWFREGTLSAFRLSDGVRLPDRDIELAVHGNDDPRDVWSDGETLWVVDGLDRKLYAYAVPGLE